MRKTKTMDFKGNDYSKVTERIKEFRKDNPNGLIETIPTMNSNEVLFKARILKDKSDPNSAEATGHSLGASSGPKEFEKLETIAVGRALALLGYAADGEIASSEEMEEFLNYQEQKKEEALLHWTEKIDETKTLKELQSVWANMPVEVKKELAIKKEEQKVKLTEAV